MTEELPLDTRVHIVLSGVYLLHLHDHGILTIADF